VSSVGAAVPPSAFEQRYGHPPGLFVLFFAEMWERFSYYGMRALLVYYMTKGFLNYGDERAYAVYGAYTSLVYMTPFFGGLVADKLLGPRRSVVLGGALMAAGHLLMTLEADVPFFVALSLLICGNGFFKPNISTMVGSLYAAGDGRRDGGFTLFYMGINLGAALAPLVCGYVGETYGWHWGFGLATIGMLVGLAVFVAPAMITSLMITGTALMTAVSMVWFQAGKTMELAVNAPVALALLLAAGVAFQALREGELPVDLGAPPAGANPSSVYAVYAVVAVSIPVVAFLVWQVQIAEILLYVVGVAALLYILIDAFQAEKVERQRIFAALTMTFFSLIFWTFFEQAGSSLSLYTDRNVDRVYSADRVISAADVGQTVDVTLSQAQLGYPQGGTVFTIDKLDAARAAEATSVKWTITQEHVGMKIADSEVPASMFQAANPIFILTFGLAFTALWGALARVGRDPSTPVKFGLGLVQLGLGFLVLAFVAANTRGMVGMSPLIFAYLLHTTGELCLSPVGLSMITRLSPPRLVSTMMGVWFLATAYSQLFASKIAQFTGVGGEGGEGDKSIPPPIETIGSYTEVFQWIGVSGLVSAVAMFALVPLVTRWMHDDELARGGPGGH
jgi:POT family proton-dependent oligopeptide transporter